MLEKNLALDANFLEGSEDRNEAGIVSVVSQGISTESLETLHADSKGNVKQTTMTELWQPVPVTLNDNSTMTSISILKKWSPRPTSISQMNALLLRVPVSSPSMPTAVFYT